VTVGHASSGLHRLVDEEFLQITPFVREAQAGGFW
jgi:hypothetical protein